MTEQEVRELAERKRKQEQDWKHLCEATVPNFMMEHDLDQVTIVRTGIAKGKFKRKADNEITREITFIS